jgi:hypothetical protein
MLSLAFSIYSPTYPLISILLRLILQWERKVVIAFLFFTFIGTWLVAWISGNVSFGEVFFVFVAVLLLLFVISYSIWIYLAKHHYRVKEALVVYPLHERLRPWVARNIDYVPVGTQLFELHLDPTLIKQVEKGGMDHVRAGVRVAHAARHLTTSLLALDATASVIGTTYEPRLAETATLAVKKQLRQRIDRPGVCPLGERRLFPNKTWDTFVWELATNVR